MWQTIRTDVEQVLPPMSRHPQTNASDGNGFMMQCVFVVYNTAF
jgi:hypothetical protein